MRDGIIRAATAAPAPPDDPPDEWARFHGFRVGPNRRDFGGRQQSEFRAGAFAEDRDPGIEEALGEGAGVIGDIVLIDAGAESRSRARKNIQILQQERNTGEGPIRKPVVDLAPGIVVMFHHHRVDFGIDLGGAGDRLVQQFGGADVFLPDQIGKADPVIAAVFPERHIDTREAKLEAVAPGSDSRARPD